MDKDVSNDSACIEKNGSKFANSRRKFIEDSSIFAIGSITSLTATSVFIAPEIAYGLNVVQTGDHPGSDKKIMRVIDWYSYTAQRQGKTVRIRAERWYYSKEGSGRTNVYVYRVDIYLLGGVRYEEWDYKCKVNEWKVQDTNTQFQMFDGNGKYLGFLHYDQLSEAECHGRRLTPAKLSQAMIDQACPANATNKTPYMSGRLFSAIPAFMWVTYRKPSIVGVFYRFMRYNGSSNFKYEVSQELNFKNNEDRLKIDELLADIAEYTKLTRNATVDGVLMPAVSAAVGRASVQATAQVSGQVTSSAIAGMLGCAMGLTLAVAAGAKNLSHAYFNAVDKASEINHKMLNQLDLDEIILDVSYVDTCLAIPFE